MFPVDRVNVNQNSLQHDLVSRAALNVSPSLNSSLQFAGHKP